MKREKKNKKFINYKEKFSRIHYKQLIKFLFYSQFNIKLNQIIEIEFKLVKTFK